jgi:hypothetical protein
MILGACLPASRSTDTQTKNYGCYIGTMVHTMMPNYLDYKCLKCGSADGISVSVIVGVKLLSSGYSIEDLEIDDCCGTECDVCGYVGEAKEFAPLTGASHSH